MYILVEKINSIGIILSIIIIIIFILLTELGSYIWHRWGMHRDIVPFVFGIQNTHAVHHQEYLKHGNDFVYTACLVFLYAIVLAVISYSIGLSLHIYLILYIPVLVVFLWNWYIHHAYHIRGHWLNKYDWFKEDKQIHFQHHNNTEGNYGIASHFTDHILGTFDNGVPSKEESEKFYYNKETLDEIKNHFFYKLFDI